MSTHIPINALAETLFNKNRRAVLSLLYGHPDQEYYLRRIVYTTGGGHGAVQRELKSLSDAGVLCRTVRDNQVYFQANSECPVFSELMALIVKTAGAADVLKAALAPLANRIEMALIYGSVARAEQRRDSDVDVLVVGEVTFREVVAALADAQARLRREVNPAVYSPEEFREKMAMGHYFLTSVLNAEKIYLIGGDGEAKGLVERGLAC